MEWSTNMSEMPKDGKPIHVFAPGYEWPEVVRWEEHRADVAEELGEDGYWSYAEELLAEVTDDCGPEEWTHWCRVILPESA